MVVYFEEEDVETKWLAGHFNNSLSAITVGNGRKEKYMMVVMVHACNFYTWTRGGKNT